MLHPADRSTGISNIRTEICFLRYNPAAFAYWSQQPDVVSPSCRPIAIPCHTLIGNILGHCANKVSREWAPFEADGSLGTVGTTVKLTTVGAPTPQVSETRVTRADAPKVLEYNWGGNDIRWELEPCGGGTRLTLWHNIDRRFISMGAAGWHICFDVLDRLLIGTPIGRIVGARAMKFDWPRLNSEYAKQFGIETRN